MACCGAAHGCQSQRVAAIATLRAASTRGLRRWTTTETTARHARGREHFDDAARRWSGRGDLWKEATVQVSEHPVVHTLAPTVPESDGRQSDVFVRGMSIGRGLPVVGDMCTGSPLHSNGAPYPRAATEDAQTIDRLTRQKHNDYPELVSSNRVHFVVLACEEGGRWGPDVFEVMRDLVRLKVAPLHPLLRRSAALAYTRRWWSILAMGA